MRKQTHGKLSFYSICFALLVLLAAGCSPIARVEQEKKSGSIALEEKQTVGQTMTATYAGLTGVEVFIYPGLTQKGGDLRLHLLSSPDRRDEIAQAVLPADEIIEPGYYAFLFPPLPDSNQKDYYFTIDLVNSSRVDFATSSGDAYLNGALYLNDRPVDSQMAFRLLYNPAQMIGGLLLEGIRWIGILLAGVFLFVLPGWAILSLVWKDWGSLRWLEKAALSTGTSLAVYPVLLLWTDLLGIHLGPVNAWGPAVLGLGYIAWRNRRARLKIPRVDWRSSEFWGQLAIIPVLGLIILVRMWVVRNLSVPLWGDSYHHTVMAQLIVDHGGLFANWQPYADLFSLTYHFGLHSFIAAFHWVTRLPMPEATLWTGQLLNVYAVLALYPLAVKLGRSSWAGCVAILCAGLLAQMPMFYTNWGRYSQLAGQVVLPAAIWIVWEIVERLPKSVGIWIVTGVIWSGLALTHYRIFLIGVLFLFVLLIALNRKLLPLRKYARMLVTGGVGIFLLAPWLYRGYAGRIMGDVARKLSTPAAERSSFIVEYNAIGPLETYLPLYLWLLALLVAVVALVRREKNALILLLWAGVTLLAVNPNWIGLPGEGIINNFALFIFAYFWVALLVGSGVAFGLEWLKISKTAPVIVQGLLFLAVLGLSVYNLPARRVDIQVKNTQLVTRADQRAARWIKENTPKDARFLVNSLFAYGNSLIAGTDGGWWLPLLAERANTVPPMPYGVEDGPFEGYVKWVNQLPEEIAAKGLLDPDVLRLLEERKITHIYIGQQQGGVNNPGPQALNPSEIGSDPHFVLVYHQDRVWIFAFRP